MMFRQSLELAKDDTAFGRAVLREQYRSLCGQIPAMYALMLLGALFLGFIGYRSVPHWLSLGGPALICVAATLRILVWMRRRHHVPPAAAIRRYLACAILTTSLITFSFGVWGLILFGQASLMERASIGLYIFVGATGGAYFLQTLPRSASLVMAGGAFPMAVALLFSGDWVLAALGLNLLFVAGLTLRLIRAHHASFLELLASRTDLIAERERARQAEERAHHLAYFDPLTGLANRNAFTERLDGIVAETDRAFALLLLDFDRFKAVNDVHGHEAGDALLREGAARLAALVPPELAAYRIGGDEFATLVPLQSKLVETPERLAERLVSGFNEPFRIGELVHHIGASIGIAAFPRQDADRQSLLRRADIALYEAKAAGRSQYRTFRPAMDAEISCRSAIEVELREAIRGGRIIPHYQPVVDLAGGAVTGFELLARWERAGRDPIGPDRFVPIAEECGLIDELMLKLLERGCIDARSWGPKTMLAINVSPIQLSDPRLSQNMIATLRKVGFPPQRLTVEITENALIADPARARRTLESLKKQGVSVALDDFGIGYSSLQHLHILPFDKIKIDRSFVQAIDSDREALKIVRAIARMADSLDLPVVAEGIESDHVARIVEKLGCSQGQGFHFGPPMPAAEATRLMNAGRDHHRSAA